MLNILRSRDYASAQQFEIWCDYIQLQNDTVHEAYSAENEKWWEAQKQEYIRSFGEEYAEAADVRHQLALRRENQFREQSIVAKAECLRVVATLNGL